MNRPFYIVLMAQFLSALADNALLFAAIGLLLFFSAPEWFSPLLQTVFVIAYIVLAPLVGPFGDALPKGRVMLIANTVKFVGCLTMLAGLHRVRLILKLLRLLKVLRRFDGHARG